MKRTISLFLACLCMLAAGLKGLAVSPPPDGGYAGGNTAEGQNALLSLTAGTYNTAVGVFSLLSNAQGSFNTAIGAGTLLSNTADNNTATGAGALLSNAAGVENTANGVFALFFNDAAGTGDGSYNSALGAYALFNNTEGSANTASGDSALFYNTAGFNNAATGAGALFRNIDGTQNTANGCSALQDNTSGTDNTASGAFALLRNTVGNFNTGTGLSALEKNTEGDDNTANGFAALGSNMTGSLNTAMGSFAGYQIDGDYNICIGAGVEGNSGESNTIHIGDNLPDDPGASACFIGGISDQTAADGIAVFIDTNGKLGTLTSSSRFKDEIKPMGNVSDALFALKPVIFRYKKELDPAGTAQFGLVAEDVAKVNRDLVVHDKGGKPYSVRYDAINAMLLNEFLREHRKVEDLKNHFRATVARQQEQIAALVATVKEQAEQIRKVSARLEATNAAPQVVENP